MRFVIVLPPFMENRVCLTFDTVGEVAIVVINHNLTYILRWGMRVFGKMVSQNYFSVNEIFHLNGLWYCDIIFLNVFLREEQG